MRTRPERFGAIVALTSPPALVSVDRVLARRIGVEGGPLWEEADTGLGLPVLSGPTEVHLAVSERCPVGCQGCYADAQPDGFEPTFEELRARLRHIAAMGAFSVAFGGGEPALRSDIAEVASYARTLGLVPTLTTSGAGISSKNAGSYRAFAQVNVSHDGVSEAYRAVRGHDGVDVAERAIGLLSEARVPVGVNAVLTRHSFDHICALAERAERLGVVELQLLRYKPAGRARLEYLDKCLTPGQVEEIPDLLQNLSEIRSLSIRVDCAMVPFLSAPRDGEPALEAQDLVRFGVMGCEAGRSLMTVDAHGGVRPCSFWQAADRDGGCKVAEGDAWLRDETLQGFRAYAASPSEPCLSCELRPACRSGCRIVAGHLCDSAYEPDPECPRVRRSRAGEPPPR